MADIVNNVSWWVAPPRPHAENMKVAYLLYPRFTALDVVGTFQVLAAAPGTRSVFVAARAGAVVDDTGLCALQATASLGDVASADVLVVPGSDCSCHPGPHPGRVDPFSCTSRRPGPSASAPDPATSPPPVLSTVPRPPPIAGCAQGRGGVAVCGPAAVRVGSWCAGL